MKTKSEIKYILIGISITLLFFMLLGNKIYENNPKSESNNIRGVLKNYVGKGITVSSFNKGTSFCMKEVHGAILKEVGDDYFMTSWSSKEEIFPFYNIYRIYFYKDYLIINVQ